MTNPRSKNDQGDDHDSWWAPILKIPLKDDEEELCKEGAFLGSTWLQPPCDVLLCCNHFFIFVQEEANKPCPLKMCQLKRN